MRLNHNLRLSQFRMLNLNVSNVLGGIETLGWLHVNPEGAVSGSVQVVTQKELSTQSINYLTRREQTLIYWKGWGEHTPPPWRFSFLKIFANCARMSPQCILRSKSMREGTWWYSFGDRT